MLLWCAEGEPPSHPNLVRWSGAAHAGSRSLSVLIESRADELRARYLAWVHDLGSVEVDGRRLREWFGFGAGYSLWEQSMFVEQSQWKQRSVESLIRLFALETLLDTEKPPVLEYAGDRRELYRALAALCRVRGIDCRWRQVPEARARRSQADRLPRALQGLLAQFYFAVSRFSWRGPRPVQDVPAIYFCAPFFDPAGRLGQRPHRPQYWTQLPDALRAAGRPLRWIHFYYPNSQAGSVREARAQMRKLAADRPQEEHVLLDDATTAASVLSTAARWLRMTLRSFRVGAALKARFERNPGESYWPVIRDDWARSFRGYHAVENLFLADWVERTFAAWRPRGDCLYLLENQGWEHALAAGWRRHGSGRLAGVLHSTIRFWDLRYHCDPRRYLPAEVAARPGPEVVIANGPVALAQYLATCAQRETVFDAEALRYGHLPAHPAPSAAPAPGEALRLLVIGEHLAGPTAELLRLVGDASAMTGTALAVTVKPHPSAPVAAADYPDMNLIVDTRPIAHLAPLAHLVFASNVTSGAVDALASGARVLVHDDLRGLNVSPLRGVAGVRFVHNAQDLRACLDSAADTAAQAGQAGDFFTIDPALPRWRRFFALNAG